MSVGGITGRLNIGLEYFQNRRFLGQPRQVIRTARSRFFPRAAVLPDTVIPPLRNEKAANCKIQLAEWRDLLFVAISRTADPSGKKRPREDSLLKENCGPSNPGTGLALRIRQKRVIAFADVQDKLAQCLGAGVKLANPGFSLTDERL